MKRFFGVLVVAEIAFFAAAGVMLFGRMGDTSVAMLGGVLVGVLIAAPITGLSVYLVTQNQLATDQLFTPPQPVTVVVPTPPTPQQPIRQSLGSGQDFFVPPRRRFYIIGEDGQASELLPDDSTSDVIYGNEATRL